MMIIRVLPADKSKRQNGRMLEVIDGSRCNRKKMVLLASGPRYERVFLAHCGAGGDDLDGDGRRLGEGANCLAVHAAVQTCPRRLILTNVFTEPKAAALLGRAGTCH
jgi:hypothetical protein